MWNSVIIRVGSVVESGLDIRAIVDGVLESVSRSQTPRRLDLGDVLVLGDPAARHERRLAATDTKLLAVAADAVGLEGDDPAVFVLPLRPAVSQGDACAATQRSCSVSVGPSSATARGARNQPDSTKDRQAA